MKPFNTCLVGALLACGVAAWPGPIALAQTNFGDRTPSAQEVIDSLDPPKTRGIQAGAASSIRVAPPAAPAAPAAPPSISMQVGFDFDSDRMQTRSTASLDNLARALKDERLKAKTFDVVGHTDGVGSIGYNMNLSQRRANAVKSYLVNQGVDPSRLKTVGKGQTDLLNKQQPAAAENRRVEIAVAG